MYPNAFCWHVGAWGSLPYGHALYYIEAGGEGQVQELRDGHSSYFKSGTATTGHKLIGLDDLDITWPV